MAPGTRMLHGLRCVIHSRALSLPFLLGAILQFGFSPCASAGSVTVNGITFSDRLGGFVLEKASGQGSMDDPFVLTERMTDPNGGTLAFVAPMEFGNQIGSQHRVGFALIKVIENATGQTWNGFELELQSTLGTPSDDTDGLSFGQGSTAGRPFSASPFQTVTVQDSPYDRIEISQGRVPVGGRMKIALVISLFDPLPEAYLVQRPSKPIAMTPAPVSDRRLASR